MKILQMGENTQQLQEKLNAKTQQVRQLKKGKGAGSQKYNTQEGPHHSSLHQRNQKSVGRKTVVVAREKGTQTPMSFLSAKQTRVFLNDKHNDIVQDQKQQIYYQLSNEVAVQDEYLEHIKNLESQIEYLQ